MNPQLSNDGTVGFGIPSLVIHTPFSVSNDKLKINVLFCVLIFMFKIELEG